MSATTAPRSRPRITGDRELEILAATVDVLAEVGYDRLTMDSVATAAKASKASLYRRWSSKESLVLDALCSDKAEAVPDTGTLRDDLIAAYCGCGRLTDEFTRSMIASMITAINRDAEFAAEFRTKFLAPKLANGQIIFDRARARGEVRADLDVDLIAPALAGIVLHRAVLMGESPTEELVTHVIDQIILPACRPLS